MIKEHFMFKIAYENFETGTVDQRVYVHDNRNNVRRLTGKDAAPIMFGTGLLFLPLTLAVAALMLPFSAVQVIYVFIREIWR